MEGPSAPDGRSNLRLDFTVWLQTAVPIPRPQYSGLLFLPLKRKELFYFSFSDSALTLKQMKLHRTLGEIQTGQCSRMCFGGSSAIYITEMSSVEVGHSSSLNLRFPSKWGGGGRWQQSLFKECGRARSRMGSFLRAEVTVGLRIKT